MAAKFVLLAICTFLGVISAKWVYIDDENISLEDSPSDVWKVGDGSGGSEVRIATGIASREICYAMCAEKAKKDKNINGVTFGVGGGRAGECYCETGMTGHNNNKIWVTTKLQKACVDPSSDVWKVGDGSGGSEVRIAMGVASKERCFEMCFEKAQKDKNINGVTFGVGSGRAGECYCETGMTGHNNNKIWITTGLDSDCVDENEGSSGWSRGDGTGGTEKRIAKGVASKELCYQMCFIRQQNEPDINGVTFGVGKARAGECYCEYKMTGHNRNKQWITKSLSAPMAGK